MRRRSQEDTRRSILMRYCVHFDDKFWKLYVLIRKGWILELKTSHYTVPFTAVSLYLRTLESWRHFRTSINFCPQEDLLARSSLLSISFNLIRFNRTNNLSWCKLSLEFYSTCILDIGESTVAAEESDHVDKLIFLLKIGSSSSSSIICLSCPIALSVAFELYRLIQAALSSLHLYWQALWQYSDRDCGWDLAERGWDLAERGWDLAECGWDLAALWVRFGRVVGEI